MNRIVPVYSPEDIFPQYQNTPISALIKYHNLHYPLETYQDAQILIGMCMDNRKQLNIPDNFAYIIRSGGGNLRFSEFKVSYAIAVGKVRCIALIAHNHCAMVNLVSKKEEYINGLVEHAGWEREWAHDQFMNFAPLFEIGNEIDFVLSEAERLRQRYPKILVAPLFYDVNDNCLYLIRENSKNDIGDGY